MAEILVTKSLVTAKLLIQLSFPVIPTLNYFPAELPKTQLSHSKPLSWLTSAVVRANTTDHNPDQHHPETPNPCFKQLYRSNHFYSIIPSNVTRKRPSLTVPVRPCHTKESNPVSPCQTIKLKTRSIIGKEILHVQLFDHPRF